MPSLPNALNGYLQEIRSNRLLQYGLIAVVLLGCTELALRWSDGLVAKEEQLRTLRNELHALRNQSRDEGALRRQLHALEGVQRVVDQRLWVVSSDAVGQAHLKDWLTAIIKKAGSKNFNLVLSSPRAMGAREGGSSEISSARSDDMRSKAAAGTTNSAQDGLKSLREVRANLTLPFTPASLEQVLSDIEGGEPLATVESLSVNRRDRKVDMTVRVLMHIGESDIPLATEPKATAATATQRGENANVAAEETGNAKSPTTPVPPVAGMPFAAPKPLMTDPVATASPGATKAQPPVPANAQAISAPNPPATHPGRANSSEAPRPPPGVIGGRL